LQKAERPFQFVTASYLVQIQNLRASTLTELNQGLEASNDASIFFHTFHSLGRHHFLTEGFSNDFAHWVEAALNRAELAEQLASLDVRQYTTLAELRRDLHRIVGDFCRQQPTLAKEAAFEPFHFCEAVEVALPLGISAWNLEEFSAGLRRLSHSSLHYHFIASRLRLQLQTNDFSLWIDKSLGRPALAARMNGLDIYTNTLDGLSALLIKLVKEELGQ